jgi:hypothetical protein
MLSLPLVTRQLTNFVRRCSKSTQAIPAASYVGALRGTRFRPGAGSFLSRTSIGSKPARNESI